MAETSFPRRHPVVTTLLGLFGLLLVAGGVGYFATNRGRDLLPTLEKPTFNVQNVTREKLKAEMKVGLRNHTPLTLRIDSLRYETYLDNARLAQGRKDRPTVVRGNATSQIELPLTLNLPQVIGKLKTAQQDCATVRMRTVL